MFDDLGWLLPVQENYLSPLVTGLLVLAAADPLAQHRLKSGIPKTPGGYDQCSPVM